MDEYSKKHGANGKTFNKFTCNFRLGIIAHQADHFEPRRFEVLSDGHPIAACGTRNEDALDRHDTRVNNLSVTIKSDRWRRACARALIHHLPTGSGESRLRRMSFSKHTLGPTVITHRVPSRGDAY